MLKSVFSLLSSQEISRSLVSFQMIFQALQSEFFRFKFHSLGSKLQKIPEYNLDNCFSLRWLVSWVPESIIIILNMNFNVREQTVLEGKIFIKSHICFVDNNSLSCHNLDLSYAMVTIFCPKWSLTPNSPRLLTLKYWR